MAASTDIIVLVFDAFECTKQFCERVEAHTKDYRLCLWDNGSTDQRTLDYLTDGAKAGRWEWHHSPTNLGIVTGRNKAVEHFLKADRFVIIDNDQYVDDGWMASLSKKLEEGCDIVGPEAWRLIPPATTGVRPANAYFPFRKCSNPNEHFCYIGCGGQLIRRAVYDKIGLYDEQFNPAYFEDPDFSYRAIQAGFRLGWVPDAPITHIGGTTTSRQSLFTRGSQFRRSLNRFQQKWYPYYCEVDNNGNQYKSGTA